MLHHVLECLSAPAHVGAMACLAVLVSRRHAGLSGPEVERRPGGPAHLVGTICVLASFLFLPAGSFPAYTEKGTSMGWWFTLFALACTALACTEFRPGERRSLRFACAALGGPAVLSTVYAVCTVHAQQRGFPGSAGYMESVVAVPLGAGANAVQRAGLWCLAAASLLYTFSVPAAPRGASFLGSCLALARIRFVVCLFVPVLSLAVPDPDPHAALLVDYVGYWIPVVGLLFLPTANRPRRRRLALGMVATGALLCLL